MIDVLIFPDTRMCLDELIHGTSHLGNTVTTTWKLQPGETMEEPVAGPFPLVLIKSPKGTQGYVDRVEQVALECYAEGQLAEDTLESVVASIAGDNIETPSGFLDNIHVLTTPEDVPYQSDRLNMAIATLSVTTRPVD